MKLQRISAISMMLAAGTSFAAPVNTDFQVHDEASYQAFAQAVRTSQYVRYDYALDQNPSTKIMLALPWGVAVGPVPHLPLPVRCVTHFLLRISFQTG